MSNGVPSSECKFEVSPVVCKLNGTISTHVYEVGGQAPTTIIGTDQDWYVEVDFELFGHLIRHLCGSWCICVYLESIGPGPEIRIPNDCKTGKLDPCGDGKYKVKVEVPAGHVPADSCGALYILGVTLTTLDACGKPGHIAAYCKGPNLMFYEQPPH